MASLQFNSHATNQDIISDITFLLGGVGVADYSLIDRTRSVNAHFSRIWTIIFESYNGWKFMDDNTSDASTGVPYADQTITSGTSLYALPTGSLAIDGVAIKLTASNPLTNLYPLSYEEFLERGGDGYFFTNSTPQYYMLQGDILRILPTPNYTLASAIRVYFEQDIASFASTDTTKVPGFASPFHRMLSVGAALDFAVARNMADRVKMLTALLADYDLKLRSFYSKRFRDRFPHQMYTREDLVREFS